MATPAFSDLAGCKVFTSAYKWLSSKLLSAQQQFSVRPYFTAKVVNDTVDPNQVISTSLPPLGNGSMVTAPDGKILAVGLDGSNNIVFYKGSNLHGGAWDSTVTLDTIGGGHDYLNAQNNYSINVSEYINGTYHIDVLYFGNFVNSSSDLKIYQQYSDDGGVTWTTSTISPSGMASSNYDPSATPLWNLSIAAMKPTYANGVMTTGWFYIKQASTATVSTYLTYNVFYMTHVIGGSFSSEIKWSQRNVNSTDWTIHSLATFYFNAKHYVVFSAFRNFVETANTYVQYTNYGLYVCSVLQMESDETKDVWSSARSIFSTVSNTFINQNSFTFPYVSIINSQMNLVFRAVTVSSVNATATGSTSQVVTTSVNYMLCQSVDAINFSYPMILVMADGTAFNDASATQKIASYTNQGSYIYLGGNGVVWEYIQNNVTGDLTSDVIQYSISESAGQPASVSLSLANNNNIWVGQSPTRTGASAIARNKKIIIEQGFYNSDGDPEIAPRNVFYIDDIVQNVTAVANDVTLVGRDIYKKMKSLVVKYAFGWLGTLLYADIFDGSTLSNWSQQSGSWIETANTLQTSAALGAGVEADITLNNVPTITYGSLLSVCITAQNHGYFYVYALYIDSNNWLRFNYNFTSTTWIIEKNTSSGGIVSLATGTISLVAGNIYNLIVKQYEFYKFNFMMTIAGNNTLGSYGTLTLFDNGGDPVFDLTSFLNGTGTSQKWTVGLGGKGDASSTTPTFSFFKYSQFNNSDNIAELFQSLATKASIFSYKIQNTIIDFFYDVSAYVGTFTNPNRVLTIPANTTVINGSSQVSNGEIEFVAKLNPVSSTSAYGMRLIFRADATTPTNAYYCHIQHEDTSGFIWAQFERLYSGTGTTYTFPAVAHNASGGSGGATAGDIKFDLTVYHTYKISFIDGWLFAYIDGVQVAAWNDNNTTAAYLTNGYWGWFCSAGATLSIKSMRSTAFWKQVASFSLNPGDDIESAVGSLIQTVRAWVFSNLMAFFKAVFLNSSDASSYTYNNQLTAQGSDTSDKEFVSQVTVYGSGVSAIAQNTTLMSGRNVRELVIVDYAILTQQDAQTRANFELINANQFINQYNPKQLMNVGAEIFDPVTVVNTGNNSTGISSTTRVYSQKLVSGSLGSSNEYSVEIQTGNL